MAKTSGLGASVTVDNSAGTPNTISNDVTDFNFGTPRGVDDVTGVDLSYKERLLLLGDFTVDLKGKLNTAASKSHVTFRDVVSTNATRTTVIVVGGATMTAECWFTDYKFTRAASGTADWQAPGVLANGVAPAWS